MVYIACNSSYRTNATSKVVSSFTPWILNIALLMLFLINFKSVEK